MAVVILPLSKSSKSSFFGENDKGYYCNCTNKKKSENASKISIPQSNAPIKENEKNKNKKDSDKNTPHFPKEETKQTPSKEIKNLFIDKSKEETKDSKPEKQQEETLKYQNEEIKENQSLFKGNDIMQILEEQQKIMEMMLKNAIENQWKFIKEENKSLHEKFDNCQKTIIDLNSKIEVITKENILIKEENRLIKEEVKEMKEVNEEKEKLIEFVNNFQFYSSIKSDIDESLNIVRDNNILQNQRLSNEVRLNRDQFEFIKDKQSESSSDNED